LLFEGPQLQKMAAAPTVGQRKVYTRVTQVTPIQRKISDIALQASNIHKGKRQKISYN
jgi:hypothetical protein